MKHFTKSFILTMAVGSLFLFAAIPVCQAENQSDRPSKTDFVKVDVQPEILKRVAPDYPAEARKMGIEGKVVISALVDTTGHPAKVEIARSSGYKSLDEAALKAAKETLYKPGMQDGKPIAIWINYTVKFVLDEGDKEKEKSP